ncbi:MAG TPA: FAD-binding oxidoreductase [Thermomicrobiales bacterium]
MSVATQSSTRASATRFDNRLVEDLRSRLTGELITATSPGYDEARLPFSFLVDPRPLAIVQAANDDDIVAAIDFARDYDLPLTVRGGGHGLRMDSMVDDAIAIDLSHMKAVQIDPEERIARVQGGATSGDLTDAAHEHGLALSTGDTASVGLGGLVTGGGIGFMVRKYGLAIDNLLSARVVTASGEIMIASETENPDLFWAIRGGGGNFGVVSEFTFRLAPVEQVLGGELILPASHDVIRGYLDYLVAAPEELTVIAHLMRVPPLPNVPEPMVGKLVLSMFVTWAGDETAGERALAPLRALATPLVDTIKLIPYRAMYDLTAHQSQRQGISVRSMFADSISHGAIDQMLAAMDRPTPPISVVQLRGLGGAVSRVSSEATAFAHRRQPYFVSVLSLWMNPADDAAPHQDWVESLWQAIRHEGSGAYVNFLAAEGDERIREAYPDETYTRLAEIKRRYDPENLFQFNQNIPPRA